MLHLLNSIHPPMYNYLPLIVIFVFEIIVVGIELSVFAFVLERHMKKKDRLKEGDKLSENEVWIVGFNAIVLGNVITFLIGMVIYLLIGGQL
jgi:hypothetical protein